jgi:hypothetical protein
LVDGSYSGFYGSREENGVTILVDKDDRILITCCDASLPESVFFEDGTPKKPDVILVDRSYTLVKGTDYTLSYQNNVELGTATVTYTGVGRYTGSGSLSFRIVYANTLTIPEREITVRPSSSGSMTVALGVSDLSGSIVYVSDNAAVAVENGAAVIPEGFLGTVHITVTAGGGDYQTLSDTITLIVSKKQNTLTLPQTALRFDAVEEGSSIGFDLGASDLSGTIVYACDNEAITVNADGSGSIPGGFVGSAVIHVTAGDEVYETAEADVSITVDPLPYELSAQDIRLARAKTVRRIRLNVSHGAGPAPVFASDSEEVLIDGSGSVTVPANYVGVAHITISCPANSIYSGPSLTATVTVCPPKPSIAKLAAGKNAVTVNWKKIARVDGFEIEYSGLADFSASGSVSVEKGTAVKKKIGDLTRGSAYYIRIRSYCIFNGERLCSDWSAVKRIKIAKGSPSSLPDKPAPVLSAVKSNDYSSDATYMRLRWYDVYGAEEYEIGYRAYRGGKWRSWTTFVMPDQTGSVMDVVVSIDHGVNYGYRVRGRQLQPDGSYIYSAWSDVKTENVRYKPRGAAAFDQDSNMECRSIEFLVKNTSPVPLTIGKNAKYYNEGYTDFTRDLYLVDSNNGRRLNSLTIMPGEIAEVTFVVQGRMTWYDVRTVIYLNLKADGVQYRYPFRVRPNHPDGILYTFILE